MPHMHSDLCCDAEDQLMLLTSMALHVLSLQWGGA